MPSPLLDALDAHVVVADGAMGTALREHDLSLDDFAGLQGCDEILNVTRPDVVRGVHRAYFEAGADAVETNTFGANLANLAEYGIPDRIRELSLAGARLARDVADEFSTPQHRRFVLGSVGPGTKLPTLGHAKFTDLRDAYAESVRGLLEGGIDAVVVEASQDLLQAKAAIIGARHAMHREGRAVPVIAQVTVETTGTMLLGSEIGAALCALEPLGIDLIGLTCATGPAEMSEHLRYLAEHSRVPLSVMPNADGQPEELAEALARFVTEFGARLVGGCCGTTSAHIRAVAEAVRDLTPRERRPRPEPGVSSLYQAVPFQRDTSVLVIGERANVNGSKAFRAAMLEGRFEDCVEIARGQARAGAHLLDLCVDYPGRDGVADMTEIAGRLATASRMPIMLDSTEVNVLEAGLQQLGGRCAINSVSFQDGAGPASRYHRTMELATEYGAAVVALCADETGQARTAQHKVAVASRLIEDLTRRWGMRFADILVDPLVFTVAAGRPESRCDAAETIRSIRQLKQRYPLVRTTLGLSNVSFGLDQAARQVLNSVFLHECVQAGLDTAIMDASKILPMAAIADEQRTVALDLLDGGSAGDRDPLTRFVDLFAGGPVRTVL